VIGNSFNNAMRLKTIEEGVIGERGRKEVDVDHQCFIRCHKVQGASRLSCPTSVTSVTNERVCSIKSKLPGLVSRRINSSREERINARLSPTRES
jgi:hypothetical protein